MSVVFYVCSYIAKITKKKIHWHYFGSWQNRPSRASSVWHVLGLRGSGLPRSCSFPTLQAHLASFFFFLFLMELSHKDGVCLPQVLTQRPLHNVTAAIACVSNAHLSEMSSNHLMGIKYVNAFNTETSPDYPDPHLSESPSCSLWHAVGETWLYARAEPTSVRLTTAPKCFGKKRHHP